MCGDSGCYSDPALGVLLSNGALLLWRAGLLPRTPIAELGHYLGPSGYL